MNAKTPHPLTASELLEISVVIPTHNSDKYISTTIEKTVLALRKLNLSFELIIVDDCSTDSTFQNCTELQVAYKELRIVRLVRNQGQRNATSVGYSLARSKYVVTFDDDLQYSPEEISLLHEKILKTNSLIISGYSSFKEEKKWYKTLKKSLLASFNNVFFPKYKNSKFISSFKMYNKLEINKTGIINIFYFWEINPNKISSLRVSKNIGLRHKSTYNFKAFAILLAPLLLKILSKSGFAFSLASLPYAILLNSQKAYAISLISFLLSLFFVLLIYIEKSAFLRAKHHTY